MIELAQLFTDMETMVVQQDAVIQNVEQKGEETKTHMVEANVQLKRAGDSARAARRKKWWCLLIARKCSRIPQCPRVYGVMFC